MILLVLPSSVTDLLKKVFSPLDGRDDADSILVGERDDVIIAYVVWFQDRFRVFISPFF